jgi:hypothetical protein
MWVYGVKEGFRIVEILRDEGVESGISAHLEGTAF